MNENRVEELLRRTAPVEAPFGARRSAPVLFDAPPPRGPRWVPLAVAAVFALVFASVLLLPSRDAAAREADRLVGLLGSGDLSVREAAARGLLEGGDEARRALERAARHGTPDLRRRAEALLRERRIRDLEFRCGRLSESGDFWIAKDAYADVASGIKPRWTATAFVEASKAYFLLLEEGPDGPATMLTRAHWPEVTRKTETLPVINIVWGEKDVTWQLFRDPALPLKRHDLAELFEHWPRLRRSDLVLVCSGGDLAATLRAALDDPSPRIRRAGALGLRHLFRRDIVDLALDALRDPDPGVRAAAADTIGVLVDPPAGADPRAWWRGVADPEERLRSRCEAARARLREAQDP